jgi:hypothetical protein
MTADCRVQALQHVLALARQGLPSAAAQHEFDDAIALVKYNETVQDPAYPDKSSWLEVAKDKCASCTSSDTAAANAGLATRTLSPEEDANRKLDPEMVASMAVAQDFKCFCCGAVMRMRWHTQHHPLAFSVARVFPALPHTFGNCVLVCLGCHSDGNQGKRARALVGDHAFARLHDMLRYPDTRRLVASLSFWERCHPFTGAHNVERVEEYVKTNEHGPVDLVIRTHGDTSTTKDGSRDVDQLDSPEPVQIKRQKLEEVATQQKDSAHEDCNSPDTEKKQVDVHWIFRSCPGQGDDWLLEPLASDDEQTLEEEED